MDGERFPGLSYSTGAIEDWHRNGFLRAVVNRGGTFTETFAPPGWAVDATFRTEEQAREAAAEILRLEQTGLTATEIEEYYGEYPEDSNYFRWFAQPCIGFTRIDWIRCPLVYHYSCRRPIKRSDWHRIKEDEFKRRRGVVAKEQETGPRDPTTEQLGDPPPS